jgi:hypothetical protein
MLSASERHREALLCIVLALRMTDALEQAYIANKPAVNGQDAESPSTCAAVTATSGGDNSNASRTNEEGVSLEPAESAVPQSVARRTDEEREGAAPLDVRQSSALLFSYPPARREFVGSLEAACFHNAAVELERLGLHEMALVCYRSGHELARHSLGEQHPLTAKLQQNIEELFLAVNYKHFLPDGRRPGDRCTAFDDPDRALRQLNFTYYASSRHRDALLRDNAKAKMLLQQAADPRSPMSSSVAPSSTLQHRRVTSALKI